MDETGLVPRWASAPGATIATALAERHLSTEEFAQQVGLRPDEAQRLLVGDLSITVALARRLANVVGASATFWLTREAQYLEDRARVEADHWSQALPVAQMASFGWIEKPQTWQQRIAVCLDFFDVPDVDTWQAHYDRQVEATHYRTSPTFDLDPAAASTWFRAAELIVESRGEIPAFDPVAFTAALARLRRLTRERDPEIFIPLLASIGAECGVNVVVVRAPTGCPASGAARMYRGRPLIQLSARFLTDDHLWFSFFHEAGHVVNHSLDLGFIDAPEFDESDEFEQQANDFATECLLGPEGVELISGGRRRWSQRDVVREALALDVSPGVIVGQLQHLGALPRDHLNGLKRRYEWTVDRLRKRERT